MKATEAANSVAQLLPVSRGLRIHALAEGGLHAFMLIAAFFLLSRFLPTEVTLVWLLQSALVALFVHWRLYVHLAKNHAPGGDRIRPTLGAANRITLFRGLLMAGLAGCVGMPLTDGPAALAWMPGGVYLAAAALDVVDGLWARRTDTRSVLGEAMDIELDALGLLAAATVGIYLGRLPLVYLSVGAAYYLFRFGIRHRRRHGKIVLPLVVRPFARLIAGIQMGFAGVALLPIFPAGVLKVAALYFMLPLVLGFFWDWLVVSGRTSGRGAVMLSRLAGETVTFLPPFLRLVLLPAGLWMADFLYGTHSPLTAALWCLLGFMMTAGWFGRTAALPANILLALVLPEVSGSPGAWICLSCTILILIFGTGRWSLWQPEDGFLLRPVQSEGR